MKTRIELETANYFLQQIAAPNAESKESLIYTLEKVYSIDQLQQTLKEVLQVKFDERTSIDVFKPLEDFLAKRWQRIRHTDLSYTHSESDPLTAVCLSIAQALSPILDKNVFELLMPTINLGATEIYEMKYLEDRLKDKELQMHQFILNDDDTRIIEVLPCLNSAEEEGVLKHTTLFGEPPHAKVLSETEKKAITDHSKQSLSYYQASQEVVKFKKQANTFGASVQRLIDHLRQGSVRGGIDGEELKAGVAANIGIVEFDEFLQALGEDDKQKLFALTASGVSDTIGSLWGRLARPKDTRYQETRFCVQLIGNSLETILQNNSHLFGQSVLQSKEATRDAERKKLEKELKGFHYPVNPTYLENGKNRLIEQLTAVNSRELIKTLNQLIKQIPIKLWPETLLLKIVLFMLKNANKNEDVEFIMKTASSWEGFDTDFDKHMADMKLSSDLIELIFKFMPNKIIGPYSTCYSYLGYLCFKNEIKLISELLENDALISQLNGSQADQVLLYLVFFKQYEQAKRILQKSKIIRKEQAFEETVNTALHTATLEEKADPELITLLSLNNQSLGKKNKEGKTAFLIAAEKQKDGILDVFFAEPTTWQQYDVEDLQKIIFQLVKNNHLIKAERLMEYAIKRDGFLNQITKWLTDDADSLKYLKLIMEFCSQQLLSEYKGSDSYFTYLARNNKIHLLKLLIQNDFLRKLANDKVETILLYLLVNKNYSEASCILKQCKDLMLSSTFPETGNSGLHLAILEEKTDLNLFKLIYKKTKNEALTNKENKSPLLIAAEQNKREIIDIFFEEKPVLHQYDNKQLYKILFHLLKNRNLVKADIVLSYAKNQSGFLEEIEIILQELELSVDSLKVFIKHCPDKLTGKYKDKSSLLAYLLDTEKLHLLKYLFQSDYMLSKLDENQLGRALLVCIEKKLYNEAKIILQKTKPAKYRQDNSLNTALHYAVREEKPDCDLVKLLTQMYPVSIDVNSEGKTPLLIAAEKNCQAILDVLIEDHAAVEELTNDQFGKIIFELAKNNRYSLADTLFKIAMSKCFFALEIDKWLLDLKFSVNLLKLIIQHHPKKLLEVYEGGYKCFLTFLIAKNKMDLANVIFDDPILLTHNSAQLAECLYFLGDRHHYSHIKKLLQQCPHIPKNLRNINTENTVLHLMVSEQKVDLEIIRLLHQNNNVLFATNKEDKTAFMIAAENNQKEVIQIFLEDKSSLEQYSVSQLSKTILKLVEHHHILEAETLFACALRKDNFLVEVDNWFLNKCGSYELVEIINKFCPNKITDKMQHHLSYVNFLCANNYSVLFTPILKNDGMMSRLSALQIEEIITTLMNCQHYEQVKFLLEKYHPVLTGFKQNGNTALHNALQQEKIDHELVQLLCINNSALHVKNKEGKTAFLMTAEKNKHEFLQLFLSNKSSLLAYDSDQLEKIILELIKYNHLFPIKQLIHIINDSSLEVKNEFKHELNPNQMINLNFLTKVETKSNDLFRNIVELVASAIIDVSNSPADIVKVIADLKNMKELFQKCYTKSSDNRVSGKFVWEGEVTNDSWVHLVNKAKEKIISIVRLEPMAMILDQEILQFLNKPTLKSKSFFRPSLVVPTYVKAYEAILQEKMSKSTSPLQSSLKP